MRAGARWRAAGAGLGAASARGDGGGNTGVGYEVLLDVRVPQMGAQEAERALPAFLKQKEEEAKAAERMQRIDEKVMARIPLSSAERAAWLQWMGLEPQTSSSSSGGKKEEKEEEEEEENAEDTLLFLPPVGRDGPGQHVRVRGPGQGGCGVFWSHGKCPLHDGDEQEHRGEGTQGRGKSSSSTGRQQ